MSCLYHEKLNIKHIEYGDWEAVANITIPKEKCICLNDTKNIMKSMIRENRRLMDKTDARYCPAFGCNKKIHKSVVDDFSNFSVIYHRTCLHKVFTHCNYCRGFKLYSCKCNY
jgi:hypothetical protein